MKILYIPTLAISAFLLYLVLYHTPVYYPNQVGLNTPYVYGDRLTDIISLYRKYNPLVEDRILKLVFFSSLLVERITDDQLKRVDIGGMTIQDHEYRSDIIETRKEIRRGLDKEYRAYKYKLEPVDDLYISRNRDLINEVYTEFSNILDEETRRGILKEKIGDTIIFEYVFGKYIEYVIDQED